MSNLSVGTILSVAVGSPATYDQAGFAALSFTAVGEVTSIPDFGGTMQVNERIPLATGIVDKKGGSINYGESSVEFTRDLTDTGQDAIKAGFDGANARAVHSFKIFNATIGSTIYFTAVITSDIINVNDANSFFNGSFTVSLTNSALLLGGTTLYTVTYGLGTNPANGSIIGASPQYVYSGDDATSVYAAPVGIKTFVDWSDGSTDNPRTDTNVTANIAVTANFSA